MIISVLISCEKNQRELDFDCYINSTSYNSNDEIIFWSKDYYKNDNKIKFENSEGQMSEFHYDKSNNLISVIYENNKTEYEYNSENKRIKSKFYINNKLDYFSVTIYKDTLIQETFSIDNNGDTIGKTIYNYNSDDLIKSVISNNTETYYYYSENIDSVISSDTRGASTYKKYLKNDQKIYEEIRGFDYTGAELSYIIRNWEYNDDELLIRKTEETYYSMQDDYFWSDNRYQYNSNNQKSRSESFDKSDNLLGYSIYYYDDLILKKYESFDNNNSLTSYTLIDNNCDE